jgi:hypothetical protein
VVVIAELTERRSIFRPLRHPVFIGVEVGPLTRTLGDFEAAAIEDRHVAGCVTDELARLQNAGSGRDA